MKIEFKNKKYKILEPFFKKEKKLRDIEKETDISYSTLKRWVSQYKDCGEKGLIKKERVDKNTFKKVNDEILDYVKKLYRDYHNLPVTKLYERAKTTLNSYNSYISYPTFFRIINNLDENIKKNSTKSINKDGVSEYGIIQKYIPIPFFDNKNKIFYLTIFYNKESYKVINFIFEEEKRDIKKIFNFIQQSIIIEGTYPKNISLDQKIDGVSKILLRNIFFKTKINFIQEKECDEMISFLNHIDTDILKEFTKKKPKDLNNLLKFLKRYLFIDNDNQNKINKDEENQLLYFLTKYKRKVYTSGIRLKNNIYNTALLKEYEGKVVDVWYNEFSDKTVKIYLGEKFICEANLIKN